MKKGKKTMRMRILEVLGISRIPISTPDLIIILDTRKETNMRSRVWAVLSDMRRREEVEMIKQYRRDGKGVICYWRRKLYD